MTDLEQLDFIKTYFIILNCTLIKNPLKPFSEIYKNINLLIKTTINI